MRGVATGLLSEAGSGRAGVGLEPPNNFFKMLIIKALLRQKIVHHGFDLPESLDPALSPDGKQPTQKIAITCRPSRSGTLVRIQLAQIFFPQEEHRATLAVPVCL